ncbi:MAG: transcription elongation factor Spt5 [Candidatus Aenigmarchaeota archaeon]|nr:transcription elongation factor Spt5 [Candidatus Aenigmarchaeota archaeon]
MLATIRTTTGRENIVMKSLEQRIHNASLPIKCLFRAEDLRGYVFIEGDANDIEETIKGIPHIRGFINHDIPLTQLEAFLVPEKSEVKLEIKDIVEIISSPFKGEKARITRIDETKNEITVEFLEAAIPIPVTISANAVRLHEKKKE